MANTKIAEGEVEHFALRFRTLEEKENRIKLDEMQEALFSLSGNKPSINDLINRAIKLYIHKFK